VKRSKPKLDPPPQLRGQWRGAPNSPPARAALGNVVAYILAVTDEDMVRRDQQHDEKTETQNVPRPDAA